MAHPSEGRPIHGGFLDQDDDNDELHPPGRVLVVEDHVMMAEGLRTAIDQAVGLEVVALATRLDRAVAAVSATEPDVAIVDHPLPDADAPTAIAALRAVRPHLKIIVISASADHRSVVQALEAGADGYIVKDESVDVLVAGIRTVLHGDRALSPVLLSNLLSRLVRGDGRGERLNRRQQDVLQCLADGMSTDEIGARLQLSRNAVRHHTQRILTRLGAHSKLEAVAIALREGLIRPAELAGMLDRGDTAGDPAAGLTSSQVAAG